MALQVGAAHLHSDRRQNLSYWVTQMNLRVLHDSERKKPLASIGKSCLKYLILRSLLNLPNPFSERVLKKYCGLAIGQPGKPSQTVSSPRPVWPILFDYPLHSILRSSYLNLVLLELGSAVTVDRPQRAASTGN